MSPELKGKLQMAGADNGNSLNREIVERLERSFDPDQAEQLASAFRPHLEAIGERNGKKAASLIVELLGLLKATRSK